MAGTKPDLRMVVWDKENKRIMSETFKMRDGTEREGPLGVMVGWNNERGTAWQIARGWSLHGPNGEVIHADEVALYERSTEFKPHKDTDNIPF